MEIIRLTSDEKELFEQVCSIRKDVFIIEQNVDADLEFTFDDDSRHYLLLEGEKAIATARWRETGKGIKLERFAVIKKYRKHGYGKKILDKILEDVKPLKKPIYLHSHANTSEFYRKNNFEVLGHSFYEVGHELYRMVLKNR